MGSGIIAVCIVSSQTVNANAKMIMVCSRMLFLKILINIFELSD